MERKPKINQQFSCMDDCIHLKACRRMQKIIKSKYNGMRIARYCTEDCTCYEQFAKGTDTWGYEDEYKYTEAEVKYILHKVVSDVESGYTDNLISDYIDPR